MRRRSRFRRRRGIVRRVFSRGRRRGRAGRRRRGRGSGALRVGFRM